jgi:putative spermidine/putrescine transport system permease protein
MATVADVESGTQAPTPATRPAARRRSFAVWRWMILLIAGVFFLIPLYAGLRFAGLKAFGKVFTYPGFGSAVGLSLRLAVITTVLTLVLMVPTTVYVHLRLPQIRRSMEGITILPIVIPPIVLIIGVLKVAPGFLLGTPYLLALVYVILAMPFAYRSLDAGLRAFDLKTMVEASNSLGAGWPTTLWRVVLPNIRTAMLSATVLTVALVLGEFTMASLALYEGRGHASGQAGADRRPGRAV